ncbi:hypothetical protein [Streptomyces sp. NPDC003697]
MPVRPDHQLAPVRGVGAGESGIGEVRQADAAEAAHRSGGVRGGGRGEQDHQRRAAPVDHEMAFAAIDLLPWVVATAFFPDRGRFD